MDQKQRINELGPINIRYKIAFFEFLGGLISVIFASIWLDVNRKIIISFLIIFFYFSIASLWFIIKMNFGLEVTIIINQKIDLSIASRHLIHIFKNNHIKINRKYDPLIQSIYFTNTHIFEIDYHVLIILSIIKSERTPLLRIQISGENQKYLSILQMYINEIVNQAF